MILAAIQARSGSNRLPGKSMMLLPNGKSLVQSCYESVRSCVECTVVVTHESDDTLQRHLRERSIPYYQACEEDDVLGRYHAAATAYRASTIVRITADCPRMPSDLFGYMFTLHGSTSADFTSDCFKRTYPDGYDIEIISYKLLDHLHKKVTLSHDDREHVTSYIYSHSQELVDSKYVLSSIIGPYDLSHLKVSIDTQEEFESVGRMLT